MDYILNKRLMLVKRNKLNNVIASLANTWDIADIDEYANTAIDVVNEIRRFQIDCLRRGGSV